MIPGAASSISPADMLGFTRFLTNTLDNVAAFPDAHIIALINIKQRALQAEILTALNYDWKESTLDATGGGSVALVADDATYAFPTDLIQLDRIEISYTGEPNSYSIATIAPLQGIDRPVMNTNNTTILGSRSNPVVYIRNKVITIDPVPDMAVTGGLKIWGTTLIADLTVGGTAPVFDQTMHEVLCYDAAETWCATNEQMNKANRLAQQREMKFLKALAAYSTRNATKQPKLAARHRSMK